MSYLLSRKSKIIVVFATLSTLFFIGITEIVHRQLVEMLFIKGPEFINSDERIILNIAIPSYLFSLHFLLTFYISRYLKKSRRLVIILLGLWCLLVINMIWRMVGLSQHGIYLPIVDQWPLAVALFTTTSLIVIVLSFLLNKLDNKNQLIERLYDNQTKIAEQLREQLHENEKNNSLLKEQASRLESLDAAKSRFFAGVSHEFRTPLMLISGPLSDVKNGMYGDLNDIVKNKLELAINQSNQLIDLVNELLEISRLEASALTLVKKNIDLKICLSNIIDQLTPLAAVKKIIIHKEFQSDCAVVDADEKQLRKVIVNLIVNAIKYTENNGKIFIVLKNRMSESLNIVKWEVAINDTGIGIPELYLEKVFERFHQLSNNNSMKSYGVGLGLPLAREIARMHNGDISVTSQEGLGSQFSLTLPQSNSMKAKPSPSYVMDYANTSALKSQIAHSKNECLSESTDELKVLKPIILIVEDNKDLRDYIAQHLKSDYQLLECANGQTGYNTACRHIPDLIISDIMMPKLDGYQLCQKLKSNDETCFIPVILLTALVDDCNRIDGYSANADDYLTKPFNPEVLRARVKSLLISFKKLLSNQVNGLTLMPDASELINRDNQFVKKLELMIKTGISDPKYSIEKLAKEMFIDRTTLYRKVREIYQLKPSDLLTRSRLQWAKQLLEDNTGSIGDIAFTVGYSTNAHFSKSFKAAFQCTPSEYRKCRKSKLVENLI